MCNNIPECTTCQLITKPDGFKMECSSSEGSSSPPPPTPPIYSDGVTNIQDRPDHPAHKPTGDSRVFTFYPTLEEFRDFNGYIKKIEQVGAHLACGIAKIVPPPGWHPRPSKVGDYSDIDKLRINNPVLEKIQGRNGCFMKENNVYKKVITVGAFRELANSKKYSPPPGFSELTNEQIESYLFKRITSRVPIYGADTEGTIYEPDIKEFNMKHLNTILDTVKASGKVIKGVNSVYLYFGMFKTCFPFHSEDMDLYSINYLHYGAPKYWFAIPPESADRFERMMKQQFSPFSTCDAFLRHKTFIVTPSLLTAYGIPFGTMKQNPNEFIITFPKGYHMGFNLGYNCAESTNFASDRWIDFGKNAHICSCYSNTVRINMMEFMEKYRPDEFKKWKAYWYETKSIYQTVPLKPSTTREGNGRSPPKKKPVALVNKDLKDFEDNKEEIKNRLAPMFSSCAIDFYREREYNSKDSLKGVHCSVCNYFATSPLVAKGSIPARSVRLVTSVTLSKTSIRIKNDPHEDRLLTCQSCSVTVHPSCYGGELVSNDRAWLCLRCRNRPEVAIKATSCCLCEMRGGALIPCHYGKDKTYAHVICAIFNRRTALNSEIGPIFCYTHPSPKYAPEGDITKVLGSDYVNAFGDQLEVAKYECEVCGNNWDGLIKCIACPDEPVNAVLAHVTCGREVGYHFEHRDFPRCTAMLCDRHNFTVEYQEKEVDVKIPSEVTVCLNDTTQLCKAVVVEKTNCFHLVVEFFDSSISENILPIHIMACSCDGRCDGICHITGARVRVRWVDNQDYDGYYRATIAATEYTVQLVASNQIVSVTSSEIFPTRDSIPSYLKRKPARRS